MGIPLYVVRISGESVAGQQFNGTGFIVSPKGHVVTCRHVVVPGGEGARKIRVHLYGQGDPWEYSVRDSSEEYDLAVLEGIVPPTNETARATLHNDWHREARIGQRVVIFGHSSADNYPAGQQYPGSISSFSEKDGRVGLIGEINPGDSGGPVLDEQERVIGIIHAKDRFRDGHSRFIPVSLLINLLDRNQLTLRKEVRINSASTSKMEEAYNPFTWRKGITTAEDFFDREEDQLRIRDYLHKGQNCQIVGPRRIGKTSLLLQIERIISKWKPTALLAYIDLQDARSRHLEGWLWRVSEKLRWSKPATNLGEFNEHIEGMINRNVLPVLCLDEFEEFTRRRDDFDRDFFSNLRYCGSRGMAIITASCVPLNQLTEPKDPTSPFYNTFPLLRLGTFSDDAVHDFLSLYRPGVPSFEVAEKEAIRNFAKGYPLALQVACLHVINSKTSGFSLDVALQNAVEDLRSYSPSETW